MLGILSGPGLFARFSKHISYGSLSKYLCRGICGLPLLSITSPSKSCHGYFLTPHVHSDVCSGCL